MEKKEKQALNLEELDKVSGGFMMHVIWTYILVRNVPRYLVIKKIVINI